MRGNTHKSKIVITGQMTKRGADRVATMLAVAVILLAFGVMVSLIIGVATAYWG